MKADARATGIWPNHLTPESFAYQSYGPLIVVCIVAAVALLWGLGGSSLHDWDEANYAQLAKEMVNSGDWLTPHLNGQLWFEKPPLLPWITATFFTFFGVNEFWARATSALAGILVVGVSYQVAEHLYNRWVGLLTAITLLTSHGFVQQSRQGTTDVLLTLLIWLTVYGYLRVREGRVRWWYVMWIAFALGFMLKAWAALAAPAVIMLTLLLDRKWVSVRSKHFVLGLVMALIIVIPWHLFMIVTYGRPFFDRYVMYDLVARASTALETNVGGPLFYFYRLQPLLFPWSLLIPFAVVLALNELRENRTRTHVLISLLLLIFGTYSLVIQTKLVWYVAPIYPALAILIGSTLFQALKDPRSVAFGGLIFAACVASLFVSTRFVYISPVAIAGVPLLLWGCAVLLRRLAQLRSPVGLLTPLVKPVTSQGLMNWTGSFRNRQMPSLVVAALCLFLAVIGARQARPAYTRGEASVATVAKLAGGAPYFSRDPLLALALGGASDEGVQGPTARYYSNRPITVVWSLEELATLTSQDEARDILMVQSYVSALSAEYDFHVFTQVEPFVYATIRRKDNP